MNVSSRFAVGIHILALLALDDPEPVTSETIAGSVNTNPVVARRILGSLRDAGLVQSQPGAGGGWRLTRAAATVTLRDVYAAVMGDPLFSLHNQPPNPNCRIGRNIQRTLHGVFDDAELALQQRLDDWTIASVLGSVLNQPDDGG